MRVPYPTCPLSPSYQITDEDVLLEQYDASDDEEQAPPRPKYIRFKRGEYELNDDGW